MTETVQTPVFDIPFVILEGTFLVVYFVLARFYFGRILARQGYSGKDITRFIYGSTAYFLLPTAAIHFLGFLGGRSPRALLLNPTERDWATLTAWVMALVCGWFPVFWVLTCNGAKLLATIMTHGFKTPTPALNIKVAFTALGVFGTAWVIIQAF